MGILIVSDLRSTPVPWQLPHPSSPSTPPPEQRRQVVAKRRRPETWLIRPVPAQSAHGRRVRDGPRPEPVQRGQEASDSMVISVVKPWRASKNPRLRARVTSSPRRGPPASCASPSRRPKISEKKDESPCPPPPRSPISNPK